MRTPNPAIVQIYCWQQLGLVRHRQSAVLLFFLSVSFMSASIVSEAKPNIFD